MTPDSLSIEAVASQRETAAADPGLFVSEHCTLFNATERTWKPFLLWPAQRQVLELLGEHHRVVVLKARQLGLTWVCLAYLLWHVLLHPAAVIGIFSRREEDAQELLDFRLKGMYDRLPPLFREHPGAAVYENSKTRWVLANGSTVMAFPTTGGRQYTFSVVLVDEADFQPDLPALLSAVEPTVAAGGQILLVSSTNKDLPLSRFKSIYRAARVGENRWTPVFLPWTARPDRDSTWYAGQVKDCLSHTGALDDLHQEYPETDSEALAPRSLDKRIPSIWLEGCFQEAAALAGIGPALPNLIVFNPPNPSSSYVIGCDPAEGNPTSDESALTVLCVETGEEAAQLSGRFQPTVIAAYADALGKYYCGAALMVERNNHGHTVLSWLEEHSKLTVLLGHDHKFGWMSSKLGKSLLYDDAADTFRDKETVVHSFATVVQLASIEGSTLRAPEGEHDDRADSYALACAGRKQLAGSTLEVF